MKNKMSDLRNHLFETLEALKDSEKPMEIDRAKAICGVAHQLIESAKVEVKFIETTGQGNNGEFFDEKSGRALTTGATTVPPQRRQ